MLVLLCAMGVSSHSMVTSPTVGCLVNDFEDTRVSCAVVYAVLYRCAPLSSTHLSLVGRSKGAIWHETIRGPRQTLHYCLVWLVSRVQHVNSDKAHYARSGTDTSDDGILHKHAVCV